MQSVPVLLRGPRRHVVFFLGGAAAIALGVAAGQPGRSARDRGAALAHALGARGLEVDPANVRWVDPPRGAGASFAADTRALVRAPPARDEPNDLFLVDARLSPEGVFLGIEAVYAITETTGADEDLPVVRAERAAYVATHVGDDARATVNLLDLSGGRPPLAEWSRLERLQHAVSSYQQTGRLLGIEKRTFAVDLAALSAPPVPGAAVRVATPADVRLELSGEALIVVAGREHARIPLEGEPADLPVWLRDETAELARPGNLVTWAVDRVRAMPFVGDDGMQIIKAVAFTALDLVMRNKEAVTGDTGAAGIAEDLGQAALEPPSRTLPIDPEIGWPPPPLEPWVTPPLPGEGRWNALGQDPFVRVNEGLPPAFLTTFIRSDRTRKATRVYVALWDPRQVELHMMAGTVEPKGATGEAGPGLIPRTPEVMKRVVAASNAGFQALHGEFGMMADGVVYLPPKPYSATVAVTRDGTTGFGSWPEDTSIPEDVLSYRQNMTVMVQDEKWNPFGRTWWGGTPPGWPDKTHTVRTGICLTRERFVAYFYGAEISPEALSQAMIQVRCSYGIALDMNAGHSGLEFYKVAPAAELGSLGRPLQNDWEAEGDVQGLDGWRFRGRRFIRGMGLMSFPRYIRREARDFFYMTLRPALPGPPVAPVVQPPASGEGEWRVKGLPQHGFPYALALTELRPDAAAPDVRVRVLKVDPRAVRAEPAAAGEGLAPTVAVVDAGDAPPASGSDALSLWCSAGAFSIAPVAPVPGAVRLATGHGGGGSGLAGAAVGVVDEDGMLVYVELAQPARGPKAPSGAAAADQAALPGAGVPSALLDGLLRRLGCGTRILLATPLALALGGDTDLSGAAVRPPSGPRAVRLRRADVPGAKRIFEATPTVPFEVWYPLQQKRIRYFKKPQAESGEAASAGEAQ